MAENTSVRFLLTGPSDSSRAWLVRRGRADLFLVDVEQNEASGYLFHVLTLGEGDAVPCVGTADVAGRSVTLLCQLRPDAELQEVAAGSLQRENLQRWVNALTEASGLKTAAEAESLEQFHRDVLGAFAEKRALSERSENERLQRKDQGRAAGIRHALSQMTSVLDKEEETRGAADDTGIDIVAAFRMVTRSLGVEVRVPKAFVSSADPTRDVASLARASGIRHREVSLLGQWWKQDNGPLLGFQALQDGTFIPVALLRRKRSYAVYDPVGRNSTQITAATAASISPSAVMFYRSFPARPITWKDLLFFGLFDTWRDAGAMLVIGALSGLLALVAPIATGILFDTIIPGAERSQLYQMAALLFAANMVTFLISLTSSAAMRRMEGRMEASIQSAVWDRVLSLPVKFFKDYNSGDLVTRSLAIGQIRKMLTGTAIASIMSGIFSVFSFILLFRYSTSLALVASVLVLITASISALCGWLQMRYQREMYRIAGKISGLTLEVMTGISKLRMSGTESQAFARWAGEFTTQKKVYNRSAHVSIGMSVFSSVFPSLAGITIFYFGLTSLENGSGLTPGGFVAFSAAFGQFLAAALGLANTAIAIVGIVPAYERAAPIMQAIPESTGAGIDPGVLRGSVEIKRLNFRYKEDLPLVLKEVSFEIKPGEFVAFVGHSGSGKSTLFRLLLGFEAPDSGFIHFDDIDLADLDPQALRRQMGVVLQNGRVFDGDIFSNIIGSAPLTTDDAWAAARAAGLDKDIEAMPMGMHTIISEGGGGLSGGQRQRLMIARAIVHKPRILLFDEATSALDNQTQAIVSRSLEQLNVTRIVIAHRLSTIMQADRIFVLDGGGIVQQGTYEELLAQEGLFRDLAARQIA